MNRALNYPEGAHILLIVKQAESVQKSTWDVRKPFNYVQPTRCLREIGVCAAVRPPRQGKAKAVPDHPPAERRVLNIGEERHRGFFFFTQN